VRRLLAAVVLISCSPCFPECQTLGIGSAQAVQPGRSTRLGGGGGPARGDGRGTPDLPQMAGPPSGRSRTQTLGMHMRCRRASTRGVDIGRSVADRVRPRWRVSYSAQRPAREINAGSTCRYEIAPDSTEALAQPCGSASIPALLWSKAILRRLARSAHSFATLPIKLPTHPVQLLPWQQEGPVSRAFR
jgi:hypothetical protein